MIGKFIFRTLQKNCIDEFTCPRSKMYAFIFGNDKKVNLKGICHSQPKITKLEEFKNCLVGGDYQKECENYIILPFNHEMYLQRLLKSTVSPIG